MKSHQQHQPMAAINQLPRNYPQKGAWRLTELLNQEHNVEELGFQSSLDPAVVALMRVERVYRGRENFYELVEHKMRTRDDIVVSVESHLP